jgi:hypothetical protein
MVFGIHLRKDKVEEAEDMATPAYANTAVNQVMTPKSPGERADRREKGIDIDLIEVEDVARKFEELSYYYVLVDVIATDKEGNIIYEMVPALDARGNAIYNETPITTPSGLVLLQKQCVMVKQPVMAKQLVKRERPWAISVLILLNKVWPTIWMSVSVANNKKILFRTLFYEIRESMSDKDREFYGILVDTAEALCTARLEDCKDGHKVLVIKIETHKLEVSTNRGLTSAKTS